MEMIRCVGVLMYWIFLSDMTLIYLFLETFFVKTNLLSPLEL